MDLCLSVRHESVSYQNGWMGRAGFWHGRNLFLTLSNTDFCLSCCWSKGVECPAKRSYVGLVAAGVQEQAEDILVPPLLRNCLTFNYI